MTSENSDTRRMEDSEIEVFMSRGFTSTILIETTLLDAKGNTSKEDTTTTRENTEKTDRFHTIHDQFPLIPSFQAISTSRSAFVLATIIFGNALCSAMLVLCYWGFSKNSDRTSWGKWSFNTLSLLLSGILAFGMGYLCDTIGLLARGTILQQRPHSKKCIGYIIRGDFTHYARLCRLEPTVILWIFLVCSIIGRLSVALLGFAYHFEDHVIAKEALFRPDWRDLILPSSGNSIDRPGFLGEALEDSQHTIYDARFQKIFPLAQAVFGPRWLENTPNSWQLKDFDLHLNISKLIGTNHKLDVIGDKVLHTYHFQDFRGINRIPEYSNWDLQIQSHCERYKVTSNNSQPTEPNSEPYILNAERIEYEQPRHGGKTILPYDDSDLTQSPILGGQSRWISARNSYFTSQPKVRNSWTSAPEYMYTTEMNWLITNTLPDTVYVGDVENDPLPTNTLPQQPLLFNCTLRLNEAFTGHAYAAPWPTTEPSWLPTGEDYMLNAELKGSMSMFATIGQGYYEKQNIMPNLTEGSKSYYVMALSHAHDVVNSRMVHYALSQKNKTVAEQWLAAYIGHYLVNILNYVGDNVRAVEIEPATYTIKTRLLVKWDRVILILSGLAIFQVLFSLGAILYCRGNYEILDDVSSLSTMLEVLRPGDDEREGKDFIGTFQSASGEGNGNKFQWVFKKKEE